MMVSIEEGAEFESIAEVFFPGFRTRPPEPGRKLTWREIARIEPRLGELLKEIRAERDSGGPAYCANEVWYTRYKPRLVDLVGWGADSDNELMRTSAAYDLAYSKLYDVLPPCRNCWCL